jgi:hypothetical protein
MILRVEEVMRVMRRGDGRLALVMAAVARCPDLLLLGPRRLNRETEPGD